MRRTQAEQVQTITTLADACCRQCSVAGITVIAYGTNDNGAIAAGWCSIPCARKDGWPWLAPERTPRTEDMFEGLS